MIDVLVTLINEIENHQVPKQVCWQNWALLKSYTSLQTAGFNLSITDKSFEENNISPNSFITKCFCFRKLPLTAGYFWYEKKIYLQYSLKEVLKEKVFIGPCYWWIYTNIFDDTANKYIRQSHGIDLCVQHSGNTAHTEN